MNSSTGRRGAQCRLPDDQFRYGRSAFSYPPEARDVQFVEAHHPALQLVVNCRLRIMGLGLLYYPRNTRSISTVLVSINDYHCSFVPFSTRDNNV